MDRSVSFRTFTTDSFMKKGYYKNTTSFIQYEVWYEQLLFTVFTNNDVRNDGYVVIKSGSDGLNVSNMFGNTATEAGRYDCLWQVL